MRGIVQEVSERLTKAEDTYFSGNIKTLAGLYNFIWFDPDITKAKTKLKAGNFINIQGDLKTFQGREQLQINDFSVLKVTELSNEEYSLIPQSPISVEEMEDYIFNRVIPGTIPEGSFYMEILKYFLIDQKEWYEKFKNFPAASGYHHAYRHGLLHHVYGMLSILEGITNSHKNLDMPLMVTGIILHDYGKIWEMDIEPDNVAYKANYGITASLSNHALLLLEKIIELKLSDTIQLRKLKHLIGAHHNKLEWGALVEPAIPEAEILAYIDLLDAHVQGSLEAVKGLMPGGHTSKYNITGKYMYNLGE